MKGDEADRVASDTPLAIRAGKYVLLIFLLALAIHLVLPYVIGFNRSFAVVRTMALRAFILSLVMQVFSYAGSGILLRSVIATTGQRLSVLFGAAITLAGSSVGLLTGGMVGNAAATSRWLRKRGIRPEGAALGGWLPALFNEGTLLVIGIIGLIQLLATHELSTAQAIGFSVTLAVLALASAVIVWGASHRERLTGFAVRVARWRASLLRMPFDPGSTAASVGRLYTAWDVLRRRWWRGPEAGAVLNMGFDMMTLYLLFIAAGHPVKPGVLLTGYGLPLMMGKISLLPGGLGVPATVTVVVVIAYRLISF
jgi:uncharacterized membrane protein YbhN (UPF0104 family)